MTSEIELKVGDTVSYTPLFSKSTYCMAKVMNDVHLAYLKDLVKKGCTLYRGIHPSLLPEGYVLVEKKTFDDLIAGAASDSIVIRGQVDEIESLRNQIVDSMFEPEGWRLVPIVSTQEMDDAIDGSVVDGRYGFEIWNAALKIAPKPEEY